MWKTLKHWFKNLWMIKPQVGLAFGQQAWSLVYLDDHQKVHCVLIPKQDAECEVLKKVVQQKGLNKKKCVCLLEPHQYQTFLLEKPKVPSNETMHAIRWRIAELIDYPIDEAFLDYLELPCKPGFDGADMIYIIVAKASDVQQTMEIAQSAGLKPHSIEIPETALNRYLNLEQNAQVCKVLIVFYDNFTHLIISKQMNLLLMRRLECSYKDLCQHPEAFVSSLGLDIQRSLDYCSAHFTDASNAHVFVDGPQLPKSLLIDLASILGLSVQSLDQYKPSGIEATNHNALYLHYAAMGSITTRGLNETKTQSS